MASTTPYIGSKISLVSKMDIRYEGILYTVDPKDSTIALAKVRSFGTENRPTENPVPGRDEIFEYIIFKAKDVKDLIICETPKQVPQLYGGLAYDPAIMTVSQSHSLPGQDQQQPVLQSNLFRTESSLSETSKDHAQETAAQALLNQKFKVQRGGQVGGNVQQSYGEQAKNRNQRGVGYGQMYQNLSSRGGRGGGGGGGSYYRSNNNQRGGGSNGRFMAREKISFESDYDFERANEYFLENLEKATEELKNAKIEDDLPKLPSTDSDDGTKSDKDGEKTKNDSIDSKDSKYYDKSSSFFDNISCEALEKLEGRRKTNWQKERQVNQETFGHYAVRSLNYRRARGFYNARNPRGGNRNYRPGYSYGQGNMGGYRGGYQQSNYGQNNYGQNNYGQSNYGQRNSGYRNNSSDQ